MVGNNPVNILRLGVAARDSCNLALNRPITRGSHEANTPTTPEPTRTCKRSSPEPTFGYASRGCTCVCRRGVPAVSLMVRSVTRVSAAAKIM